MTRHQGFMGLQTGPDVRPRGIRRGLAGALCVVSLVSLAACSVLPVPGLRPATTPAPTPQSTPATTTATTSASSSTATTPPVSFFGVVPGESVDGEAFRERVRAATSSARKFEKTDEISPHQIVSRVDKSGRALKLDVVSHNMTAGKSVQTVLPGNGKFYMSDSPNEYLEFPLSELVPDLRKEIRNSSDPTYMPADRFWKDRTPLIYYGPTGTGADTLHTFVILANEQLAEEVKIDEKYRLRSLRLVSNGEDDYVTDLTYPETVTIITPPASAIVR